MGIEHIQHKRTMVSGRVPEPTLLEEGELALNLVDKRMFSKAGSEIVELSTGMPRVKTFMKGCAFYGGGYAFIGTDGRPYISTRGWAGNGRGLIPGNRTENLTSIGLMEIPIPYDKVAKEIGVTGNYGGFVLTEDGIIYTWGINDNGECGNGSSEGYCDLRQIDSNQLFDTVENPRCVGWSGDTPMMYAKVKNTTNWIGWGYNNGGQGVGASSSTDTTLVSPSAVVSPATGVGIARMWNFGAASPMVICLGTDGLFYGMGGNDYGCLGIGNTTHQTSWQPLDTTNFSAHLPIPQDKLYDESYVDVIGGQGYRSANNFAYPFVMLRINGYVFASGYNQWGALGQGNTTNSSIMLPITTIPQGTITKVISNGAGGTVSIHALTSTGDDWSWGYAGNYQSGGNGTTTVLTPFKVLTNVVDIWGGRGGQNYGYIGFYFAKLNSGKIVGWGNNSLGNLWLTNGFNAAPVGINETNWNWLGDIREMFPLTAGTGNGHLITYAITVDGRLYALGYGNGGSQNGWWNTSSSTYTGTISVPRRLV